MVSRVFSINTKCQIRVCWMMFNNAHPSGAFKRQNGLASARWRGCAPTSSRLRNEVKQWKPQWGFQATERSCDSKMEGLRPDKFAFALATNTPAGCLSDRTFLRKQNGGVSLRQVRVCWMKFNNAHPSGVCKRQNGLAHSARWRSFTPTTSRLR